MRALTDDERDSYAEHFYNGEPVPADDPECEWCGVVVPDGASVNAPYCSPGCQSEAFHDAQEQDEHQAGRK